MFNNSSYCNIRAELKFISFTYYWNKLLTMNWTPCLQFLCRSSRILLAFFFFRLFLFLRCHGNSARVLINVLINQCKNHFLFLCASLSTIICQELPNPSCSLSLCHSYSLYHIQRQRILLRNADAENICIGSRTPWGKEKGYEGELCVSGLKKKQNMCVYI